ncbi:hypothetical protein [Aurantimonas sp. A3-2-R12]|uniref:hypothetical protein n=1 Tax=Aurantimonas sp. A3-2-R12 TaxID=3114362 RepID=UPI002E19AD3A|nr:hypothetical protein [Aurantimonas sp. A3-2-R12]
MVEAKADRPVLEKLNEALELARASVVDLERVSEEAYSAANRARERLNRLELSLED